MYEDLKIRAIVEIYTRLGRLRLAPTWCERCPPPCNLRHELWWRHGCPSATNSQRHAEFQKQRYCRSKILSQPTQAKRSTEAIRPLRPASPSHADCRELQAVLLSPPSPVNPFRYVRSVLSAVDDVLTLSLDITGYYDLSLPLLLLERNETNTVVELSPIDNRLAQIDTRPNPRIVNFLLLLGRNICSDTEYSAHSAPVVCTETGTEIGTGNGLVILPATLGPGNFDRVPSIDINANRQSTEPKMARTNVAIGLNKGFPTTAIPKAVKPSHKKGIKT